MYIYAFSHYTLHMCIYWKVQYIYTILLVPTYPVAHSYTYIFTIYKVQQLQSISHLCYTYIVIENMT